MVIFIYITSLSCILFNAIIYCNGKHIYMSTSVKSFGVYVDRSNIPLDALTVQYTP